jgi:hypothetical protein
MLDDEGDRCYNENWGTPSRIMNHEPSRTINHGDWMFNKPKLDI